MTRQQSNQTEVPFVVRFLATGLGSGYSPIIPGTAGSLVGLLTYALPGMENPITLLCVTLLALLVGVYSSQRMEEKLGEDPQVVVIDEIVGMWISLLWLPKGILAGLSAFIFFRIYDTIKPEPARTLERLRNGWGIMLDDVAAGVYTNVTVRLIMMIFPSVF